MDDFRLHTFPDGTLIDDLLTGTAQISISSVGAARYEISFIDNFGRQLKVVLWTSQKGKIITQLSRVAEWASISLGSDATLQDLKASDCSMHLEHMDRGHYWLGLDHISGEAMQIDFFTSGYLKTRIIRNVLPSPE